MVRDHRRDRPGTLPLAGKGLRLTFTQVDRQSSRLGRQYLRGVDVGTGSRVAVLDTNGPHGVIVAFAAVKLEAVVAPLNWRLSVRKLADVLADTRPVVTYYGSRFAHTVSPLRHEVPKIGKMVPFDDQVCGCLTSPPGTLGSAVKLSR